MSGPRRKLTGSVALWLGVILAAGAGLRAAYLAELRHAPDYEAPLADAAFHDYWARGWATGDWTPPEGEVDPRIPDVSFLRPPGYPFFLSLLYRTFGTSPLAPRIAQMILGLVSAALAFVFARAALGRLGGLLVAAFTATYWASIYFEGELQAPVLLQCAGWTMLILLLGAARPGRIWTAFAAGAVLGCAALVRANVLVFAPVAAMYLAWVLRSRGVSARGAAGSVALLILGVLAVLAPVTARNHRVSGELVPVSVNGAINLYIGNNEIADGTSAKIPELEELTGRPGWSWFRYGEIVRGLSRAAGVEMSYGDVSREFTARAREWIVSHPREFAALTLKRARLFWGPDEISNNKAIGMEKENSRVLRFFPAFPWVLALCLLGAWFGFRDVRSRPGSSGPVDGAAPDGPALMLAALFVGTMFLSYVPFLAAARFRAPLVPVLFVFGAWALVRLATLVARRRLSSLVVAVGAVTVLGLLLGWSSQENRIDRAWWHTDRGVALMRQDRREEARRELEAALEANPGYVDAHVQLGDLLHRTGDTDGALAHYLAVWRQRPDRSDLMTKSADILLAEHRYDEAVELAKERLRVAPDSPDASFEYGRALVEAGRYEEAIDALTRTLTERPESVPGLINRGIAYEKLGWHEEAIIDLELALELNPFSRQAFFHLGNAYHATGEWELALAAFQEARRIGLNYVEPRVHIGNLYNERGNWEEAIAAYEDALRVDPDHVTARYNLAGSLANAGRPEEAVPVLEAALKVEPQNQLCRERLRQIRAMIGN